VNHFCNGLGHCSQKQPCRSSRTARVAAVLWCDSEYLVIPLSTTLPALSTGRHKLKENKLHSLSLPQWAPLSYLPLWSQCFLSVATC
jgi:hypothetical protein